MKIYIANFPGTVTCADLKAFFEPFGIVTRAELALDVFTGVSRGYGYVTMADAEAEQAIAALHGKLLQGLPVLVQEAPEERAATGSYRSSVGPVKPYHFRKS
ncbi:MAG: RNA-binding protein [Chitinophagaceae bacterium]|nr:MAG: RNA-binding protein [Chitinophagaceae bacterium]